MKLRLVATALAWIAMCAFASAQMMDSTAGEKSAPSTMPAQDTSQSAPTPAQAAAAKTFAAHAPAPKTPVKPASGALTPLNPRERVEQLLSRFTFGAKPGDVDQVLAEGSNTWLSQQLDPNKIKDDATAKRLGDWPTLTMTPAQAQLEFPQDGLVDQVENGKVPYPADPLLASVYEVQVYKRRQSQNLKRADGGIVVPPTDAELEQQKVQGKADAERIAGDLYALPKAQRMAALIAMPVPDRIAFTQYVGGDQRTLLINDMTPREREAFYAMGGGNNTAYMTGQELANARITRDILTERQLQEVMTDFWFNHFNIYVAKGDDQQDTTAYERDVIRKGALGNFKDLLLATAQSAAMMVYLDNWLSIGPDSLANGVNPKNPASKKGAQGLNENYGREVMELHTVGVNGGYSQADVTALSAILTGWGIDYSTRSGGFKFYPNRHEPGPKRWFGYIIDDDGTLHKLPVDATATACPVAQIAAQTPADAAVSCASAPTFGPSKIIADDNSVKQGIAALTILALAPQTAHFISTLLAQKFVADTPPPALVDKLTKVFLDSHGDIKTVLRALMASPEFNSRQYFRNKVKTPVEFVASTFRATGTNPDNPQQLAGTISNMGMAMYYALPPTGYYLTADQWMNSNALIDRLNFSYALTNNKLGGQKFDAPKLLAMGLLAPSAATARTATKSTTMLNTPASDPRVKNVAAITNLPGTPASVGGASGTDVALRVIEISLLGNVASPRTNELIYAQLAKQPPNSSPTDTLNLITALVIGSPEFQSR